MSDAVEAVFDPALAGGPTTRVPLRQVLDLLPLTHAEERVAAYRERMRAGDRFPPVSVVRAGRRLVIADGHKRFSAYAGLGASTIVVELWGPGRLLRDQGRQLRANLGKNGRILRDCLRRPAEARRQALATWGHWRRVAASLWHLARGPRV